MSSGRPNNSPLNQLPTRPIACANKIPGANASANTANIVTTKAVTAKDGLTAATASTSAYQIKQDFPSATDGFYWIQNANINGGVAIKIYADMTTDGGGWTLILKNSNQLNYQWLQNL